MNICSGSGSGSKGQQRNPTAYGENLRGAISVDPMSIHIISTVNDNQAIGLGLPSKFHPSKHLLVEKPSKQTNTNYEK